MPYVDQHFFLCFLSNTPVNASEKPGLSIFPDGIWHADCSSQESNHQLSLINRCTLTAPTANIKART